MATPTPLIIGNGQLVIHRTFPAPETLHAPPGGGDLVTHGATLSFGLVGEDVVRTTPFTVRNRSNNAVTVTVTASGDVSVQGSWEDVEIAADSSMTLTVVLNTATAGAKTGQIRIAHGGRRSPFLINFVGTVLETAEPPPDPEDVPLIIAGSNLSPPTLAQPDPVGDSEATFYSRKSIAHWDVVPRQTFDETFRLGIVAGHGGGIDRVEVRANEGDWFASDAMTLNPRTGAWEYCFDFDPTQFDDYTQVTFQAIVYPIAGVPRVLENLILFADHDGSALAAAPIRWVALDGDNETGDGTENNPYASIRQAAHSNGGDASGMTIYLKAGHHASAGSWTGAAWVWPTTNEKWLTISAAPGLGPDDVSLGSFALNVDYVKIESLEFRGNYTASQSAATRQAWGNNCRLTTNDRHTKLAFFHSSIANKRFLTESLVIDTHSGVSSLWLVRNVTVQDILSDAYEHSICLVNCEVDGIDPDGSSAHPDVAAHFTSAPRENIIFWGLHAVRNIIQSQGFGMGNAASYTDVLIANCLVQGQNWWTGGLCTHMVMWHNTFNSVWRFRDDTNLANHVNSSIRHNVFVGGLQNLNGDTTVAAGTVVDNNHYGTGTPVGTNATTGDAGFVDPVSPEFDFRPDTGSALLLANRPAVLSQLVPVDVDLVEWGATPEAIGALRPGA